jgi:hypothetical protein
MHFDGQRAFEYAKSISFPRLSAGPGERKAGDHIISVLEGFGLEPKVHSFTYSPFPYAVVLRATLLFQIVLLFAMISVSQHSPFSAAVIAILFFVLSLKSTRWGSLFEIGYDIGRMKSSRNIIVRAAGTAPHTNLIFLAHYDSKSQTLPLLFRVLCYSLFYIGSLALALLVICGILLGQGVLPAEVLMTTALALSAISVPLLFNFTSDGSPGALDNASGVGIVLELARNLSGSVPDGLDVSFVFTGAEEEGLAGAVKFAQELGFTYNGRKTYCVSYDGAGAAGKLRVTSRYGIPPVRTSRKLVEVISRFCSEEGIECYETYLPVGAGLEQTPLSYRGFDVVTVHSGKLGRAVLAIHSPEDTIKNLDREAMERCGLVGEAVAEIIAKKGDGKYD